MDAAPAAPALAAAEPATATSSQERLADPRGVAPETAERVAISLLTALAAAKAQEML